MPLVTVSAIGTVESAVEMGGGLATVIAPSVKIIELEPQPQALVDIGGEDAANTVFPILFITALVVSDVHERRFGIGEQ